MNLFRVRCGVMVLWDSVGDGEQERKMGVEKIFRGRGRRWPIYNFSSAREMGSDGSNELNECSRVESSRVEFEYSRVELASWNLAVEE